MFRNLLPVLLLAVCVPVWGQENGQALKKLSPELQKLALAKTTSDSIDLSLSVKKKLSGTEAFRVLSSPQPGFLYIIRIAATDLAGLAKQDAVLFASRLHLPKEELNTGASDPTLELLNYAQHRFPQVQGETVVTSVKERLLDTSDLDLKGRIVVSGLENTLITSHASLMATIMAGAGNSSPFARGAAPAATVSSSSFANLFPDPDSVFRRLNITVQNHSYGTAVENFYGNEAVAYDQQVVNQPKLLHVFSAGNSGNTSPTAGTYAGITNMANLSGNFKQAKNIITVSAVDSAGQALLLSSKGPAYDGRVKPELVAYGEDGSSGAAALTSGAAILVQDLYSRKHAGAKPSAALVKAALLNSADDVGKKHVDYATGFGLLNAYQALQTVNNNRFLEDSLSQGETKSFAITVPPNTAQVKLTLVWTDPPAAPNASKALVNDLDVAVKSPSGESWLPWVLSSKPEADSLLLPAHRGVDSLNNAEQISIENPAAGSYTVDVHGSRLQSAMQAFALAYRIDTVNSFEWTFPTGTDPLISGRTHALRWRTNIAGSGRVEYATSGQNWRTIAAVPDLSKAYLKWIVPDTVTTAQLRLVTGNQTFVSDTFTISPQLNLQTGFNCADSFLLYWNKLTVPAYRFYQMGERYLQPGMMVADTAVIFSKAQNPSFYYSLAPVINGREGIRSNTVNYAAQGAGCYLRSFYLQSQSGSTASFAGELGTLYNVSALSLEKLTGTRFEAVQTISNLQTKTVTFADQQLRQGENRFRLRLTLATGQEIYSEVETVYSAGEALPVLFYPNPAAQNGALKIIVQEVGRYTLQFFDATGKQHYRLALNSSVTTIPAGRFAKGLYFIRIADKDGKTQTMKQVIY